MVESIYFLKPAWCGAHSAGLWPEQLGTAPQARRLGVGKSLFKSVLDTLKARHASFALEFTVDRRNTMALDLDRAVAAEAGLQMTKKPDAVPSLEGSEEELYIMTYDSAR